MRRVRVVVVGCFSVTWLGVWLVGVMTLALAQHCYSWQDNEDRKTDRLTDTVSCMISELQYKFHNVGKNTTTIAIATTTTTTTAKLKIECKHLDTNGFFSAS